MNPPPAATAGICLSFLPSLPPLNLNAFPINPPMLFLRPPGERLSRTAP